MHEEPTPPTPRLAPISRRSSTPSSRARSPRSRGDATARRESCSRRTRSALRLVESPPPAARAARAEPLPSRRSRSCSPRTPLSRSHSCTRGSGGLASSVSPNSGRRDRPGLEQARLRGAGRRRDPQAISYGAGGVWVANVDDETVSSDRPCTTRRRGGDDHRGRLPGATSPFGAGSVWVALGALGRAADRSTPNRTRRRARSSALGDGTPVRRAAREHRVRRRVTRGSPARAAPWTDRVSARTGSSPSIARGTAAQSSSSVLSAVLRTSRSGLGSLWIVNRAAELRVVEVDPLTTQRQQTNHGRAAAPARDRCRWRRALGRTDSGDDTRHRSPFHGSVGTTLATHRSVGDGPIDVAVRRERGLGREPTDATVRLTGSSPVRRRCRDDRASGTNRRGVAAGEGSVWVSVRAQKRTRSSPDITDPRMSTSQHHEEAGGPEEESSDETLVARPGSSRGVRRSSRCHPPQARSSRRRSAAGTVFFGLDGEGCVNPICGQRVFTRESSHSRVLHRS